MSPVELDPTRVPDGLVALIPLAEKWGIGDDILREIAVDAAADAELTELAEAYSLVDASLLFDWLSGPDLAKLRLRRR